MGDGGRGGTVHRTDDALDERWALTGRWEATYQPFFFYFDIRTQHPANFYSNPPPSTFCFLFLFLFAQSA